MSVPKWMTDMREAMRDSRERALQALCEGFAGAHATEVPDATRTAMEEEIAKFNAHLEEQARLHRAMKPDGPEK